MRVEERRSPSASAKVSPPARRLSSHSSRGRQLLTPDSASSGSLRRFRRLFWRTTAFLVAGLLAWIMFGLVWYSDGLQPWVMELLS